MKAMLIAVLLVLVAGFTCAEEIKIVNGQVMLVPPNLVATDVKVTPEAMKYPDAVAEVFVDRGKEVAVKKEMNFSFFIFWMVSVVAFFVATRMKNSLATTVTATLGIAATTVATAFTVTIVPAVAVIASALVIIASATDHGEDIPKGNRIIFYVLMAVAAGSTCYTLVL